MILVSRYICLDCPAESRILTNTVPSAHVQAYPTHIIVCGLVGVDE